MLFLGLLYFQDVKVPKKSFYWMQKRQIEVIPKRSIFLHILCRWIWCRANRTKGISIIINAASKGNKNGIKACMDMGMSEYEMRECDIPI